MLSSILYDWDMFDNLMHEAFGAVPVSTRRNDQGIGYEFDLPGVAEEDIEVTVENNVLTIKGERNGRSMLRSITLPRTINSERLEARYQNGVLQILAPYAESAKPRKLEINSSKKPKEIT
jgi:HSP20 family protein